MNQVQRDAFEAAAGASAETVSIAITAIVMILALVWALWVLVGSFRAWHDGKLQLVDLSWAALRLAIVLMALGILLN